LPAVDVCVAPHGMTTFARLGGDDDAGAGSPGLAYPQVSAYSGVALGAFDARIVAAGASCATAGLVPDATSLGALANATSSTLLVGGDFSIVGTDHGITVALLPDDAVLAGGGASLRSVNAIASAGPLDFGLGAFATSFVPLVTSVAFGKASATAAPDNGAVDANGYLPIAPLSGAAFSARASSSPTKDAALAKSVQLPLGSVATAFAIGGKTGDFLHPPKILLCIDNAPLGSTLSSCEVQP
jgi:hypothetical protein